MAESIHGTNRLGEPAESRLREIDEVQRAHDKLVAIVLGEVPSPFPDEDETPIRAALDVLCWALNHTHADGFARTLNTIDTFLDQRGFRLTNAPEAQPPTPPADATPVVFDREEIASLLTAAEFVSTAPGEGPYLDALHRGITKLRGALHG